MVLYLKGHSVLNIVFASVVVFWFALIFVVVWMSVDVWTPASDVWTSSVDVGVGRLSFFDLPCRVDVGVLTYESPPPTGPTCRHGRRRCRRCRLQRPHLLLRHCRRCRLQTTYRRQRRSDDLLSSSSSLPSTAMKLACVGLLHFYDGIGI